MQGFLNRSPSPTRSEGEEDGRAAAVVPSAYLGRSSRRPRHEVWHTGLAHKLWRTQFAPTWASEQQFVALHDLRAALGLDADSSAPCAAASILTLHRIQANGVSSRPPGEPMACSVRARARVRAAAAHRSNQWCLALTPTVRHPCATHRR